MFIRELFRYLERINIIEKAYAHKFQLESSKNDLTRKMWKTLHESFKQMNIGLCELH